MCPGGGGKAQHQDCPHEEKAISALMPRIWFSHESLGLGIRSRELYRVPSKGYWGHITQTRGLTDYGVKCGNPVVLFLEPKMLRYTHCETCNCRRMRRNCVSPHALKDYSLTYHTDGHGVRTILTPPAPLAAVCTIG